MFAWLKLTKPILALAPMADMTDSSFCLIVRKMNTNCQPVIFREMVSAEAIVRGNDKTLKMVEFNELERPIIQQIFGSNPEIMARAAQIIEDKFKPDGIDINMGCPVPKMTKGYNGAALMKNPELAKNIIHAVKNAIKLPLSVKLRLGWSDPEEILKFAPMVEKAGAELITIHGRTKTQGYTGKANWEMIGRAKKLVQIPVLINGDIVDAPTAQAALSLSHCDGVAIARGALGNPWVFSQINKYLLLSEQFTATKHSQILKNLRMDTTHTTLSERFKIIIEHTKLMEKQYGDHGVILMRKHLAWYLKKLENIRETRAALMQVETIEELEKILNNYLKS